MFSRKEKIVAAFSCYNYNVILFLNDFEFQQGHLLDTMSFLDPLPPFRMKQWQLIVFLFLDALSVSQIPALTPYMIDRRILLPKVTD